MSSEVFAPSEEVVAKTSVTAEQYDRMYQRSVSDPDGFWSEHAQRIDWIKPFTKVKNTSFEWPDISIKWFEDGQLNVAANCIDRHLAERGDTVAIIFEPDDPKADARHITYRELHGQVCRDRKSVV